MPTTETMTYAEEMAWRNAVVDIANLPDRIAENEAVWGPGARPELRARLAEAERTVERIEAAVQRRQERERLYQLDAEADALNIVWLAEGGTPHLAWVGDDTNPICGAWLSSDWGRERARLGYSVRIWEVIDGTGPESVNRCKRCTAGVRSWWNND